MTVSEAQIDVLTKKGFSKVKPVKKAEPAPKPTPKVTPKVAPKPTAK